MACWLPRNRGRRLLVGTVLALLLMVSGALAQDYIFINFNLPVTRELPPAPCPLVGPAAPVVYDASIFVFYTCLDNRVFATRFLHPSDQAERTTPRPVFVVPNPHTPPPAPTPPPTGGSACPVGMVLVHAGGCVPPNHPLAGGGQ